MSGVIVSEWMDFTQEYMSWVYVVAGACVLWLHVFKGFQSSKCVRRKSLPGRVHTHTCVYTYIYMTCSMYVKLHVCMYHRIYL